MLPCKVAAGVSAFVHQSMEEQDVCSSSSSSSSAPCTPRQSNGPGLNLELGLGPPKACTSRTNGTENKGIPEIGKVHAFSCEAVHHVQSEATSSVYSSQFPSSVILLSKGFWQIPSCNQHPIDRTKKQRCDVCNTQEAPPAKCQVVGWPPIRPHRKLALTGNAGTVKINGDGSCYAKVNMDGVPFGRKVDLNAHNTYRELLLALQEMFGISSNGCGQKSVDGTELTLLYEDKDGDWMLVGDVPWEMFVSSVSRLRIVRGSNAIGLGK